jgi:MFS family permease
MMMQQAVYLPKEKTTNQFYAWLVVLTASLFFFYEFIQMHIFNTINVQLRESFHLDAIQIGELFSMYFYANFICLFFTGSLLDRFSTRKLLLFAITVSIIGTFIFSTTTQFWLAALGRFLVGIGASFCFLSCVRLASRWFSPHRMAFVTGVIVTMAMLGGLVAQAPFEWLTEWSGDFRKALWVNVGLGVVILVLTFLIVQDRPENTESENEERHEHQQLKALGLWRGLKLASLNPQNWLGGFYTALINLPVFVLGGLWGILYLSSVHHLTKEQASYATTLFFVGVIFGCLVYGWISDRIERRVLPMIVGAILSFLVMCVLLYVPGLSLMTIIILFFLVGFVTSSQVLTYPLIAELNPSFLTGTALSIDSLCIMASGFLIPPLFGWLMEKSMKHQAMDGITVYSAHDFNVAMIVMPISFVMAFIITFFMRETYCKPREVST